MPTYDYACDACKETTEIFQSFSEDPLKSCPKCKSRRFRRLIGAGAGFIFKGSGFYQTDYRSSSYQSDAKMDAPGTCSGTPSNCNGPCSTAKDAKPS